MPPISKISLNAILERAFINLPSLVTYNIKSCLNRSTLESSAPLYPVKPLTDNIVVVWKERGF